MIPPHDQPLHISDISPCDQNPTSKSCPESDILVDHPFFPLRNDIFPCTACGEIFQKSHLLEQHQAIKHAVSELLDGDSGKNIVNIIFKTGWSNKEKNPEILRILKIHNSPKILSRFEEYREFVKAKAARNGAVRRRDERCIADGNELLRFYCSTFCCDLGQNGNSSICTHQYCSVCGIIKSGFSAKLDGISSLSSSWRAHVAIPEEMEQEFGFMNVKRAMLVCRVVAGRVGCDGDVEDDVAAAKEDGGFDSVVGRGCGSGGSHLRLDDDEELSVFNPRAVLPCFVIVYTVWSAMSDFKLDVIRGDSEDPEPSSSNRNVPLSESNNGLYRMLNGIQKQGYRAISNIATNSQHRGLSDRFFRGNRSAFSLPVDGVGKREHQSGVKSGPLVSGTAYCISSCSMILLNKIVLSSYNFNAGISLMFYQNLISTLVVVVFGFFGVVSVEKLNWKLIRIWMPVNIIFVGMLVSGMYSLKYINIAMVTILKNVTNILTATGELYIFRKRQNQKVWTAMLLMIISAISGGITDLSFDSTGYAWQITNCVLTASYSLTLRRVMDKAKQATRSGTLNEVSMVLLNNLLSLPFAIFLILIFDEWKYVVNVDVIKLPMFWVVATASGFLGLAISFTSMWFLQQTGPTTYSLVGSLNKIPLSIVGIILFKVPISLPNMFSILFGLFAGIFFARAKMS
ncbi:hypothetical protein JRO89_XS13G0105500 [Xanthoceras sorbifolium]|uniref:C2H2-type domain-containing protein n=1 Tax=Xanthoceras sorbifolium TaxID=99658 RepID=A0ABQ8H7M6_9ROSI|nr:hypothetical protein JRO89_XS13G0105500 [Xanthoceras sorbifolium]